MKNRKARDEREHSETSQRRGEHTLFEGAKRAWFGGLLAAIVALIGQWFVGQIYSGYKARELLEAVVGAALFLASSVVTAAATIIALMLTMLSLTKQSDDEFDPVFFKQIQQIAMLSTIALVGGILLLLFLSMPLQESDQVPTHWFTTVYYVLIVFVAGLSGLLVGIVLMLLNAVNSLIDVVRPTVDEEVEQAKERDEKKFETDE